jgi:hypothetical protein
MLIFSDLLSFYLFVFGILKKLYEKNLLQNKKSMKFYFSRTNNAKITKITIKS